MQTNKIIQLALLTLLMLLSMVAMSSLLEARDDTRNVILGAGCFSILLFSAWRDVPIDAKLLFIVILGYALGGKGFAYVSPFEPIYIGEISLSFCMVGFLLRPRQLGFFETPIHRLIWLYLLYAAMHLIIDFESYRLLAVRDSSMAYYCLFFITAYSLFHNDRVVETFKRIIKVAMVLSILSMVYDATGIELESVGFAPHLDAYIPLSIGAILYFLVIGIEKRKIHFLAAACLVTLGVVASSKTAALLALATVIISAIVFGKISKLIIPSVILFFTGVVALSGMMFIDSDLVTNFLTGGNTAETFGIQSGEFVGFSGTSAWRWVWWTTVCNDTLMLAPFWGQGFGADITGPFLVAYMGPDYGDPTGYARYPHNVMITNFGRLGFIGVTIFAVLFLTVGRFLIKFCKKYFSSPLRNDSDLICYGIVVTGMVNGVLQATYEIPHSAITHWACLAYLVTRYYRPQGGVNDRSGQ